MKRIPVLFVILCVMMLFELTATFAVATGPSASKAISPAVPLCKSLYKKKSVPANTLQALVRSHERWVEYRGNPNAKRVELCQADLSRAALAGANLERADLEGAVLRQANLSKATLDQASLAGADLTVTFPEPICAVPDSQARIFLVPLATKPLFLTPSSPAPG
jgi:Pentapeptide repeats (8 copies)